MYVLRGECIIKLEYIMIYVELLFGMLFSIVKLSNGTKFYNLRLKNSFFCACAIVVVKVVSQAFVNNEHAVLTL